MKTTWLCLVLAFFGVSAFAGGRNDIVVEAGKLQQLSWGKTSFRMAIKVSGDKVYTSSNGWLSWEWFSMVKGFNTNDTNRTLIYTGSGFKLYYVDDVGVPPGKVKLAFIAD